MVRLLPAPMRLDPVLGMLQLVPGMMPSVLAMQLVPLPVCLLCLERCEAMQQQEPQDPAVCRAIVKLNWQLKSK